MLTGYDLSSNNTTGHLATALASDFVILKASEGVSYRNPVHDSWVAQTRSAGRLVGHYHYAHPGSNSPAAEAALFLAAAHAQPGDALVLDFEPGSIIGPYVAWVLTFADAVRTATGAPCWLYTNQSQGTALMNLASAGQRANLAALPLWKAYYNPTVGSLMGWPDWACWQHTDSPIDHNFFNGDAARWRALGVPGGGVARTTWRGVIVDERTALMLAAVDKLLPAIPFYPSQGSYTTAVAGSGGTHSGGGAADIKLNVNGRDLTDAEAREIETASRRVGFAGWYRTAIPGTWPRHVHLIAIGQPDLSVEAVYQVRDYKAGKDGLLPRSTTTGISLNPDTGTRAYVNATWETYVPEGFLMALSDDEQTRLYNTVLNIEKQGQAKDATGKPLGFDWLPAINNNVAGVAGNVASVGVVLDALTVTVIRLAAATASGDKITAADVEGWIKEGIADSVKVTGTLEVEPKDDPVP